jgi:hypothetical protein
MADERDQFFPEPLEPDLARTGTYAEWDRSVVDWLDRSALPRARRVREFLNRSLGALPAEAGAALAHRLRHDPPFERVFFELVVGRFLQVLGAEVTHQPTGLGGQNVDWRATFPDGRAIYVEATSPTYNAAHREERRRREAMLAIIERETPPGWWVIPRKLPALGLNDSRQEFQRRVRSVLAGLPDPAGVTFDTRHRGTASTSHGELVLEAWPGDPELGPIAMVSMGAWRDDSRLKVATAARFRKVRQARAFPGETVILALDAPYGGPDVEDFDQALLGHFTAHYDLELKPVGETFEADGVMAKQGRAEYAGVLAFGRVGMFGGLDPTLYRHPRFGGTFPDELLALRQRSLTSGGIADVPASTTAIIDRIGFPGPDS